MIFFWWGCMGEEVVVFFWSWRWRIRMIEYVSNSRPEALISLSLFRETLSLSFLLLSVS